MSQWNLVWKLKSRECDWVRLRAWGICMGDRGVERELRARWCACGKDELPACNGALARNAPLGACPHFI